MPALKPTGFLEGVRVVDATRLLPGGYCTMLLADMGADVVKVEQPGLGDYMRATPPTVEGRSPAHETVNRNKRSIGVDLKNPQGKEVMRRLLKGADVFIEGFRPGAMDRLGFSFEDVKAISPKIVYCSISAYGKGSKLSAMPGHDVNFQSMAGTMSYQDDPELPQLQLGDMVSGMYAAVSILGALVSKKKAVFLDVPIVQSLLSWLVIPVSTYLATGAAPRKGDSLLFGEAPYYGVYRTSDGKYVAVAAIEDAFWSNLVNALGVPEIEGRRFGTPSDRALVARTLRRAFSTKTRDEWAKVLMGKDTCATPVLTLEEAIESDWARASSVLVKAKGGGRVLGWPVRGALSARTVTPTRAPDLGEHTKEILKSLGYSPREIEKLRLARAVE